MFSGISMEAKTLSFLAITFIVVTPPIRTVKPTCINSIQMHVEQVRITAL